MKKLLSMAMAGALALTAFTASAAPKGKNVLSLKETITDNNIVFPSSYATDTQEMMTNWYLQNYAILDYTVDSKPSGNVSEAEYIRRLKQLPTTIEMPYNQVVRAHIDRYTQRSRTLVEQMLGMSLYYMPIFEEALEREGLPLELKYIPVIESAMNPNAVSPAGAAGLWQFMVGTGKGMGLEINTLVDERRDPYRSSEKAVQYFKQLYEIYGDWSLAIAAYNCGPGNVNKAIMRAGSDQIDFWAIYNYLPRETRGYVPAFIAANYVMTYYKEHNISPALAKKPLIIDTVKVNRRVNFNQISQVLNIPIDEIRVLNPQYRHDIIPGDIHPYTLALPSQQIYSYVMAEDSIYNYRRDVYAARTVVNPGSGSYELDDTPYDASAATGGGHYANAGATVPPADMASTSRSSSSTAGGYGRETYHHVQTGESLVGIAFKYGMTPDELIAINDLRTNQVSNGQVLKVLDKRGGGNNPAGDMENVTSIRPTDYNSELQAPPRPVNRHNTSTAQQTAPTAKPKPQAQQQQQVPPAKPKQQYHAQQPQQPQPKATTKPKQQQYTAQQHQQQQQHQQYSGKKGRNGKYNNQAAAQQQQQQYSGKKGKGKYAKQEPKQPAKIEVKPGENLTKISKRTGVPIDQLRAANGGKDVVQAGKTINLNDAKKGGKHSGGQKQAAKQAKQSSKQQAASKSSGKKGKKRK